MESLGAGEGQDMILQFKKIPLDSHVLLVGGERYSHYGKLALTKYGHV